MPFNSDLILQLICNNLSDMRTNTLLGIEHSNADLKPSAFKRVSLKMMILEIFYRQGSKSIPDISKIIQMSIPTITRSIDELAAEGLILEEGIGASSGGRKPNLYGINPNSRYILGIDISRYFVRMCIFNLRNQPAAEIKVLNDGLETTADILSVIHQGAMELINSSGIDEAKILGIGIALPGLIDIRTGISYSYLHSDNKPASALFEEIFHHPVFVEHDTRTMALGELAFGMAKGKQNVICLNVGSGISISMILNGQLYSGNSGYAGEFGHIQADPNGQLCYCGKIGCLETLASGTTMIRKAKTELESGATSIIRNLVDNDLNRISSSIILDAAQKGDQFAIGLISQVGEHLGKGIAVLIHLFNPELIIIGGELSNAGNYLTDPIQQNLNKYTIAKIRKDTQILNSELGENAGIMGTVALVMDKIFV
jgi:N-acetylglucosamine repressor